MGHLHRASDVQVPISVKQYPSSILDQNGQYSASYGHNEGKCLLQLLLRTLVSVNTPFLQVDTLQYFVSVHYSCIQRIKAQYLAHVP
jgi:hypothetical protein